jgi:ATP-binding cassette subfamily C protein LapB
MKRLLRQLALKPSTTVALLFSSFAANILALVPAIFVILVLNRYVTYGVDATLVTLASAALLSIVFEFVFRRLRYRTAAEIDFDGQNQLNNRIFVRVTRSKLGLLGQIPAGTLRGLFGGIEQLRAAYSPASICSFLDAPFALLFLFVLYLISPPLCLVTALVISALVLLILLQLNGLSELGRNINKVSTVKGQLASNAIETPETLRVFDLAGFVQKKSEKVSTALDALQSRLLNRQDLTQTTIKAFTGILTVAVITVGAVLVVDGHLDIGEMIGANILAARALTPVVALCQQTEIWKRADQAKQTIDDFERVSFEKMDGSAFENYRGKLEFRDVTFNYLARETPVIEKLSLSLGSGEVLCVTGANGAGKTTLTKLVTGLLEPTEGYISVDGVNLKQLSLEWWRKQIIYLPQEPKFLEGSVRENFQAADDGISDAQIRELLADVGLDEEIDKSVGGLDQGLNTSGSSLSLGVRRRLALARALIHKGKIAILDEPTEGIDAKGASHVYNVMSNLSKEGITLIICSHDNDVLNGAHHVLDLDDGERPTMRTVTY